MKKLFMKVIPGSLLLLLIFLNISCSNISNSSNTSNDRDVFLFSYFKNQDEGLRIAYSYDGLKWSELIDSALIHPEVGKEKLMRDPSMIMGPDGIFHLVWTTGWADTCIGYACSKDLINWSEQKKLDVMTGFPKTKNTWAPEITYNVDDSLYYIYWSSTVDTSDFKIFYTTTKDFNNCSETKIFYYDGFPLIDGALIKSRFDSSWFFFLKDATDYPENDKYIRFVKTETIIGGVNGKLSQPITGDFWSEGPSPFYIEDTLCVYYDRYKDGKFGLSRSIDNGITWEDHSDSISLPSGIRHGSIIKVSRSFLDSLKASLHRN